MVSSDRSACHIWPLSIPRVRLWSETLGMAFLHFRLQLCEPIRVVSVFIGDSIIVVRVRLIPVPVSGCKVL